MEYDSDAAGKNRAESSIILCYNEAVEIVTVDDAEAFRDLLWKCAEVRPYERERRQ